ncbi:LysE family translocator [Niveispirillum sp. KHB5.9]|uniref:LysE family translocator n=1 Tax=Niveispirillum sp. KHB5.9 TaxID=3400269 RepID=UPI003A855E66
MADAGMLLAFMAAALAITIVPGADMALVMGSAVGGGHRAGLAAVAGITLGAAAHVLASAVGLTALVVASPALLSALGWAGAAYLIWIGIAILRSRGGTLPGGPTARILQINAARILQINAARILRDALATNLLNPKAYLFMLAVFPQFIRPDGWAPWVQTGVLGLMMLSVSVPVYTCIALVAARAGTGLAGRPKALTWLNRISGLLLVAVGASALWSMAAPLLARG